MSSADEAALARRVANLERSAHRWRRIAGVLALAWTVPLLLGQAAPKRDVVTADVVRTRSLVVVDQNGDGRAAIGVDDGEPRLVLLDRGARPRAALAVDDDGVSLRLYPRTSSRRSRFPSAVADERERLPPVVELTAGADDNLALRFGSEDGEPRAELRVDDGAPVLQLFDDARRPRLRIGVRSDGGSIALEDAAGAVSWSAAEPKSGTSATSR